VEPFLSLVVRSVIYDPFKVVSMQANSNCRSSWPTVAWTLDLDMDVDRQTPVVYHQWSVRAYGSGLVGEITEM